jgi:hypothetical protein
MYVAVIASLNSVFLHKRNDICAYERVPYGREVKKYQLL